MSHEKLLCPQCKCPLTPPQRSATGMACPRCNNWVDFDAQCSGACLGCHKTLSLKSGASCADVDAVPVSLSTGSQRSPGEDGLTGQAGGSLSGGGWKRLFKGLFTAVR